MRTFANFTKTTFANFKMMLVYLFVCTLGSANDSERTENDELETGAATREPLPAEVSSLIQQYTPPDAALLRAVLEGAAVGSDMTSAWSTRKWDA